MYGIGDIKTKIIWEICKMSLCEHGWFNLNFYDASRGNLTKLGISFLASSHNLNICRKLATPMNETTYNMVE